MVEPTSGLINLEQKQWQSHKSQSYYLVFVPVDHPISGWVTTKNLQIWRGTSSHMRYDSLNTRGLPALFTYTTCRHDSAVQLQPTKNCLRFLPFATSHSNLQVTSKEHDWDLKNNRLNVFHWRCIELFFFQFFFNCSVVFLFYVFVVFVFLLFYIYFLNVLFLCIFCFFLVLCFFPFFEANRTLCAKVTYPGSGTQTVAFVWGPRDASGEMAMVQDDRY